MEKAKVFFTDFRAQLGDSLPSKLKRLIKKAGMEQLELDGKFAAIKMHFGELGNISYLRPNYARAVVDVVKEFGGKPFLTDCNTLYPGSRKKCAGTFRVCMGKWFYAADSRLSYYYRRWTKRNR